MTRTQWEKQLNCFGYFGFGGGYAAIEEDKTGPGYGLYCNVCPLAQGCWQEHRARARELFPDLMAELDRHLDAQPRRRPGGPRSVLGRVPVRPP